MAQKQPSQFRVELVAGPSVGVLCRKSDHDHDQGVQRCQDGDPKSDVDPHAPHSMATCADGPSPQYEALTEARRAQTLCVDDPELATSLRIEEREFRGG